MDQSQILFDCDNIATEMLELTCAKMVHEIKNPLTLVASTLQLIELEFPDVKHNKHWGKLNSELHLINHLLNEFNVLTGVKRLHLESFDLGELVADVCDSFLSYCVSRQVQLDLEMPDDLFHIESDCIKLTEVFSNLIKNAVEACSTHGHVWVSITHDHSVARVVIEDNGCGMSAEQKRNIFKPFYTSKKTGTGLGLPIVISILEQLNGQIYIDSLVGTGSKFTVLLPLDQNY